jgi:hypothetical protein
MDAPNAAARIAVVGDCGVGKTQLIRRLSNAFGGSTNVAVQGATSTISEPGVTTVGCALTAMAWQPAGVAAASPPVIELIEVGGNRGFPSASRLPFYNRVDAVVLVHSANDPASLRSLHFWFEEVRAAGLLVKSSEIDIPLPILIVETTSEKCASDVTGVTPLGAALAMIPPPVVAAYRAFVAAAERFALIALSFVLFGPFQTVVPLGAAPTPKAVIEHVEAVAGRGFRGTCGGVAVGDAAGFERTADMLFEFVGAVLRDTTTRR